MKLVRFHDDAKAEPAREARYYRAVGEVLAKQFVAAVEDAVALVSEFPTMGARYKYGTRRCFPKKFPFSIVYLERSDEVYVLAVAPFARKPGYWRSRSKDA